MSSKNIKNHLGVTNSFIIVIGDRPEPIIRDNWKEITITKIMIRILLSTKDLLAKHD